MSLLYWIYSLFLIIIDSFKSMMKKIELVGYHIICEKVCIHVYVIKRKSVFDNAVVIFFFIIQINVSNQMNTSEIS